MLLVLLTSNNNPNPGHGAGVSLQNACLQRATLKPYTGWTAGIVFICNSHTYIIIYYHLIYIDI